MQPSTPIVPLVAIGVGAATVLGLVPIVLHFLNLRRDRTLTHVERLKALESGRTFPDMPTPASARAAALRGIGEDDGRAEDRGRLARKCFSTALWVAFWGFGAAGIPVGQSAAAAGVSYAIAASVGAIGVAAMICGAVLGSGVPIAPLAPAAGPEPKPKVEDDAFDVVSSRG